MTHAALIATLTQGRAAGTGCASTPKVVTTHDVLEVRDWSASGGADSPE
jgi:hypothetical protein